LGCSIEASNTGVKEDDVVKLRNDTPEAEAGLRRAIEERQRTAEMCAAYLSRQEALEDFAAENSMQETPPETLLPMYHPMQWREGIEASAKAMHKEFMKKNPNGVNEDRNGTSMSCMNASGTKVNLNRDDIAVLNAQRKRLLAEWGYADDNDEMGYEEENETRRLSRPLPAAFEKAFAPVLSSPNLIGFMVWTGMKPSKDEAKEAQRQREEDERIWKERMANFVALSEAARKEYDSGNRPPLIGSGQLMAHFTYLCLSCTLKGDDKLKPLNRFGLKSLAKASRAKPRHGQDLHAALGSGKVVMETIVGTGFGIDSLELRLRSNTSEDISVTVQKGTIFQHMNWEHRQNLMVAVDYVISVPSRTSVNKKMMTYCMNQSCACSSGNPMNLTEFYFDDSAALESQGTIWDHFEGCFNKEE